MNYDTFLGRVVDEGIAAANRNYSRPEQAQMRRGSVAGFEACRGKVPGELKELLQAAAIASRDARENDHDNYWWYRCYEAEVEFACNVISVLLMNAGMEPIVTPTARGVLQAGKILGVLDAL